MPSFCPIQVKSEWGPICAGKMHFVPQLWGTKKRGTPFFAIKHHTVKLPAAEQGAAPAHQAAGAPRFASGGAARFIFRAGMGLSFMIC